MLNLVQKKCQNLMQILYTRTFLNFVKRLVNFVNASSRTIRGAAKRHSKRRPKSSYNMDSYLSYFFELFQETWHFSKTQGTDYTGCRQETLQEAAVCQIPIGFLKFFFTLLPPNMPAVARRLASHPDRRPPRPKESPGLGGALTPSNKYIFIFFFSRFFF